MKNRFLLLMPLALGLTFAGCKKDSPAATPAPTKTELLTNRNWVITAATISPGLPNPNGGSPITDLYVQFSTCDKDDFIRFEAASVFKEDEGATKCNSSSTQTRVGTWAFGSNDTVITIGGTVDNSGSYNVADLSDNTLKLTQLYPYNGVNYTVTATYTKK